MNKIGFRYGLYVLVFMAIALQSCGLFGGKKKKNQDLNARLKYSNGEIYRYNEVRPGWDQYVPQSMVVVPSGTFHMGQADEDVPQTQINYNKQITISAFFIDETEVTNNQYRLFTDVFIAHTGGNPNNTGNTTPVTLDPDYEDQVIKPILESVKDPNNPSSSNLTFDEFMKRAYPDTMRWRNEYAHHMGDPMMEYYFDHPAFDDYPVVGVKWTAAQFFCQWRTFHLNRYREVEKGYPPAPRFRLPSEAEWEYAARGGRDLAKYPWGSPYVRNTLGCMLANFKPNRGNYYDDGFAYTAPVASYFANDWGVYDTSGNVAEWCEDAYYEASVPITWDLNPLFAPAISNNPNDPNNRRVVRGGSWKDIAYYLETGTRTYQHYDSTSTSIGFRCAMTYLGRSSGAEYGKTSR